LVGDIAKLFGDCFFPVYAVAIDEEMIAKERLEDAGRKMQVKN